jgi:hypothetical protein
MLGTRQRSETSYGVSRLIIAGERRGSGDFDEAVAEGKDGLPVAELLP